MTGEPSPAPNSTTLLGQSGLLVGEDAGRERGVHVRVGRNGDGTAAGAESCNLRLPSCKVVIHDAQLGNAKPAQTFRQRQGDFQGQEQ